MSAAHVMAVSISPTPQQVAEYFWSLGSDGQADFFAALENIAGHRLCMQMAGVILEIASRSACGDHAAQNGLQTMLSHANGYLEAAVDSRAYDAKRAIERIVSNAKVTP